MTTQSPRGGTCGRLHNSSGCSTKTRGVWPYTCNHSISWTSYKNSPLSDIFINFRCHYSINNLPTTSRFKIINCLLICRSHRHSNYRGILPNKLRIYGGNINNNCPRNCLIRDILPGQHHLRNKSYTENGVN